MRWNDARLGWRDATALVLIGLLTSGCPRENANTDPVTDATDQTSAGNTGDTDGPPGPIEMRCALQGSGPGALEGAAPGNQLRFNCTVWLLEPAAVEIAWRKENGRGPVRVARSDKVQLEHTLTLYLMAPETDYAVVARSQQDPSLEVSQTLTTGPLPLGASVVLTTEGITSAPLIGMSSPCADGSYAVILDPHTGEVLWYHNFEDGLDMLGLVDAVSFTEDHTVMAMTMGSLIEVDLTGRELNRWRSGLDVPNRMHHDAFRKDGLTYALFSESVTLFDLVYVLDGFYIFDKTGEQVGRWRLIEHFFPIDHNGSFFADDYSHANAIWVDDDQKILVSFRHLSAVVQIDGDLQSPTFGEIEWRAANPRSPMGSDLTITTAVPGPADFEQQHNVHWLPDGRLTLFDNRIDPGANSRLLHLSLDRASKHLQIERSYQLPKHCDFQGSAWHTPAGNPLATCAPTREAYEFDAVSGDIVWYGHASCIDGFGVYIPRFVPLDW